VGKDSEGKNNVPAGRDLTMSKNKTLKRSNSIVACVSKNYSNACL
jgi:hypothetical protein